VLREDALPRDEHRLVGDPLRPLLPEGERDGVLHRGCELREPPVGVVGCHGIYDTKFVAVNRSWAGGILVQPPEPLAEAGAERDLSPVQGRTGE
jgi:hypothetical protein